MMMQKRCFFLVLGLLAFTTGGYGAENIRGKGLPSGHVWALARGKDCLWVGTSMGLVEYDSKTCEGKVYTTKDGLLSDNIHSLAVHENGLWCGAFDAQGGVSFLDLEKRKWKNYLPIKDGLLSHEVWAIYPHGEDIWFGTSKGVSRYTPARGVWKNYTPADGLLGDHVWSIASLQNELYFGTEKGLNSFNPATNKWNSYERGEAIWTLLADKENLYAGSISGLWRFQPKTEKWEEVKSDAGWKEIFSLVKTGNYFWIGHWDGVARYNEKTGALFNYVGWRPLYWGQWPVLALLADDEYVWFGTDAGGLVREQLLAQYPEDFIQKWVGAGPFAEKIKDPLSDKSLEWKSILTSDNDTAFFSIAAIFQTPQKDKKDNKPKPFAYALTHISLPEESAVEVRFGTHHGMRVWLNEKVIINHPGDDFTIPDQHIVKETLRSGWHKVIVEIQRKEGTCGFFLRVTGQDGKLLKDLKVAAKID